MKRLWVKLLCERDNLCLVYDQRTEVVNGARYIVFKPAILRHSYPFWIRHPFAQVTAIIPKVLETKLKRKARIPKAE